MDIGREVEILELGYWWPGRIVDVDSEDTRVVTFSGYSSVWNKSISLDSLRLKTIIEENRRRIPGLINVKSLKLYSGDQIFLKEQEVYAKVIEVDPIQNKLKVQLNDHFIYVSTSDVCKSAPVKPRTPPKRRKLNKANKSPNQPSTCSQSQDGEGSEQEMNDTQCTAGESMLSIGQQEQIPQNKGSIYDVIVTKDGVFTVGSLYLFQAIMVIIKAILKEDNVFHATCYLVTKNELVTDAVIHCAVKHLTPVAEKLNKHMQKVGFNFKAAAFENVKILQAQKCDISYRIEIRRFRLCRLIRDRVLELLSSNSLTKRFEILRHDFDDSILDLLASLAYVREVKIENGYNDLDKLLGKGWDYYVNTRDDTSHFHFVRSIKFFSNIKLQLIEITVKKSTSNYPFNGSIYRELAIKSMDKIADTCMVDCSANSEHM